MNKARGRKPGITPRMISPFHVVHLDASEIRPGYLLHDGMVLDVVTSSYSPTTGEPVAYQFETLHAYVEASPGDILTVYGRVTPEMLDALREAYEAARR